MLLAKNFLPSDKTVNINLEFTIKGGALSPSIVKNDPKPAINLVYHGLAFVSAGNDVDKQAGAIWRRKTSHN
jgi:hypothetical protein